MSMVVPPQVATRWYHTPVSHVFDDTSEVNVVPLPSANVMVFPALMRKVNPLLVLAGLLLAMIVWLTLAEFNFTHASTVSAVQPEVDNPAGHNASPATPSSKTAVSVSPASAPAAPSV